MPACGPQVKEGTEVTKIDRSAKTVTTRDVKTGVEAVLPYDALLLSPGAAAIRPPLPGIDLPGIFTMKTLPDMYASKQISRILLPILSRTDAIPHPGPPCEKQAKRQGMDRRQYGQERRCDRRRIHRPRDGREPACDGHQGFARRDAATGQIEEDFTVACNFDFGSSL